MELPLCYQRRIPAYVSLESLLRISSCPASPAAAARFAGSLSEKETMEPPRRRLEASDGPSCIGYFLSRQASMPPSKGRTRVKPFRLSRNATRALEISFGHAQ